MRNFVNEYAKKMAIPKTAQAPLSHSNMADEDDEALQADSFGGDILSSTGRVIRLEIAGLAEFDSFDSRS